MAKKKKKMEPFGRQTKITYNKYKPNRQARRLGIEPEEPPKKEEKKTVSKAAVLKESVQRAQKIQKQIVPAGMTYGEYMAYLEGRRQKLEEKKQGVHIGEV